MTGTQTSHAACEAEAELLRHQAWLALEGREEVRRENARLRQENQRLQQVLRHIQVWDCLNPPDPEVCEDHPWLRRLVDDALKIAREALG